MESLKEHLVMKLAACDFMQDPEVCPDPPLGTIANPHAVFIVNEHSIGDVLPLGEQVEDRLIPDDFKQLKECFAVEYGSFRHLLQAYEAHVDKIKKNNAKRGRITQKIPKLKDWEPADPNVQLTLKQIAMKKIQPRIRVHTQSSI